MKKILLTFIIIFSSFSYAGKYQCNELADLELETALSLGDFYMDNFAELKETGVYLVLKEAHAELLDSASDNYTNSAINNDGRGNCRSNFMAINNALSILSVYKGSNKEARIAYSNLKHLLRFLHSGDSFEEESF